jgi:6-phosphogluconolactonase
MISLFGHFLRPNTPRNFAINPTGKWLIAANQDSNSLVLFRLDTDTGRLQPAGVTIEVQAPGSGSV